eukprot:5908934-Pleurochrysis_carterae.AAC.4
MSSERLSTCEQTRRVTSSRSSAVLAMRSSKRSAAVGAPFPSPVRDKTAFSALRISSRRSWSSMKS